VFLLKFMSENYCPGMYSCLAKLMALKRQATSVVISRRRKRWEAILLIVC
jgi:hypothetical protein